MTNLIPPSAKKSLKFEYSVRTYSVWAFLVTGALIAATFLMVPVYVLLQGQLEALAIQSNQTIKSQDLYEASESAIDTSNELSSQLLANKAATPATKIIAAIQDSAGPGVVVSTYRIESDNDKRVVQIQGVARIRDDLASFKLDLERSPLFTEALIPISDLAKDSDLPFAITLTLAEGV